MNMSCIVDQHDIVGADDFDQNEDFKDNHEQSILHKSLSMTDLAKSMQNNEQRMEKIIPLAKSSSMINLVSLKDLNPNTEFLKTAIKDLEEHRQEQASIETQIQSLMEKSLKRREQFRAVWGVSPRSINQKRDVKTVINVQNVSFTGSGEYINEGFAKKKHKLIFFVKIVSQ